MVPHLFRYLPTVSLATDARIAVIERATASDMHEILRIGRELGYEHGPDEATWGRILSRADHCVFVARIDMGLVGWIHGVETLRLASPPFVEIVGLVVDRSSRRRGVATRLLRHVEEWASHQRSIGRMRVRVNIRREEARAFYVSVGFGTAKHQAILERSVGAI
jgi:GNAT superfamily N-acetyltransferase